MPNSVSVRTNAALNRLHKTVAAGAKSTAEAKADAIRRSFFKQQLDFVVDPFRFKTAKCGRRAGKTFTAIGYMADVALRTPEANVLYITLTLKSAKTLAWRPLQKLSREFDLGFEFNNTDLRAVAPNRSTISICGAETEADIEKFRGDKYDLILIDESKSFRQELLAYLIVDVILPALSDRAGTLGLIGSPGHVLSGLFFEATGQESSNILDLAEGGRWAKSRPYQGRTAARWKGVSHEWSSHSWTAKENTGNRGIWKEHLRTKKRMGWSDDNQKWRREFLGEWVADEGKRVYQFNSVKNVWTPGDVTDENPFGLPGDHEWHYVMGLDLGSSDPFAIVIAAYAETCKEFFQVYEFERTKLTVSAMAAAIQAAMDLCPGGVDSIVSDFGSLADTILLELQETYGLTIKKAAKKEKRDFIELLNGDLVEGRCKVLKDGMLATEWGSVQWDDKGEKERSGFKNDLSDAFLYLVREAKHHLSEEPTLLPEPGSAEAEALRKAEEVEAAQARAAKSQRVDDVELPFESEMDGGAWTQEDKW